jgi:hypothetical protein
MPDTLGIGAASGDLDLLMNLTGADVFGMPSFCLPKLIFFGATEAIAAFVPWGTATSASAIRAMFGRVSTAKTKAAHIRVPRQQSNRVTAQATSPFRTIESQTL